MSDLTSCNFCKLQGMKRDAAKKGKRVMVVPVNPLKDQFRMGGVNVYVVGRREKPNEKNWVSWMMQITAMCVC